MTTGISCLVIIISTISHVLRTGRLLFRPGNWNPGAVTGIENSVIRVCREALFFYPIGCGTGWATAVFHGSGLVHFPVGTLLPEGSVFCSLLGSNKSVHLRQALVPKLETGNPCDGFRAFHATYIDGPVGMMQGFGLISLDTGSSRIFGNLRVGMSNLVTGCRYFILTLF